VIAVSDSNIIVLVVPHFEDFVAMPIAMLIVALFWTMTVSDSIAIVPVALHL